jgi:diguanylate cyclase (GGDEF)-like protein
MKQISGEIRKHIKEAAIIIFFILVSIYLSQKVYAAEESKSKKILVLHSYSQDFAWTDEENEGIMSILDTYEANISLLIEYMDYKNYPTKENIDYLYNYYKFKYQDKKIDVIIATDDAALSFALENRAELFSDAPVVFCGVNREGVDTITKGYDRVTGVLEVIDPTETLKIAKNINPSLKNIYLLYDNSESGLSTGSIVINKIKEFDSTINIIPWNNLTYEEVKKKAKEVDENSIVFICTYYSDVNNTIIKMDDITEEISLLSDVPVYYLYDFGLNHGIIGGSLQSGRLQGENAAEMAIRILKGESPNDMPVLIPDTSRTVFDYNQIKRFNVPLKVLPKNSELINKPFSFYETYKSLVLGVTAAFIILLVFVSILIFYIHKIQKMKRNLSESHEELTQLYEELTASDEVMRQQYDEINEINEKIRLSEEKLAYLAYHDSLTGLPNKLSLYEHAKGILESVDKKSALLFIDIDNFKYVNDTLGHAFGDKLVAKVSDRLKALLIDNCNLYRLSGDEFVIILKGIDDKKQAEDYASYILANFLDDFDSLGSNLHVSLSIGIAIYPDHSNELEQLLKYADIAMYQVKEAGRKNYMVYDQAMNEAFIERVAIEKHLQDALDNNEFLVYYQPQLDIRANRITGFEALLRWNSPVLGSVSPLKFIKVAEDTHFIVPLGKMVLQNACEFLRQLNKKGYTDLTVSVNISILQLLQADFIDFVNETLSKYQIKPEYLELEITESILIESFEIITPRLQSLRNNKVRIALDDFGKGYSSLNYLKQLPITTLKVDKTFIDYIAGKSEDDFVSHIISIGKNMGMCVIAEGVENQHQLDYLIRHNCDKIQGYLFCRPKPETEIFELLKDQVRQFSDKV